LSTIADISEGNTHKGDGADPQWLLSFRANAKMLAQTLPKGEKYGIAIPALEPEQLPVLSGIVDYHVTSSKGLELYTWKEALAQEEIAAIIANLLSSPLLPAATSALAASGRAQFQSGMVIYVQPTLDDTGKSTTETLTLTSTVTDNSAADLVVIIAKTGAHAAIESVVNSASGEVCLARTVIVLTEEDAHVSLHSRAGTFPGFFALETIALTGAHSSVSITEDPGDALRYRSFTTGLLVAPDSRVEVLHVLLPLHEASCDIGVRVCHYASETTSRIYALGCATGNSRTVYRGAIVMEKGVTETDGAQEGKFLVISPTAKVDAIPALDIASKDVRSSHKLSVSHIRPADLFYAKARGIPHDDARALTVEGFFGTLLHKVNKGELLESLRARIALLLAGI
jgi:Fe-S cluster assembly scaffold protein SufB